MFSRRSKHIRVAACCTLGSAVIFWLADLQWILPHQFSTAPSSSWKSGSNVNKNYSQAIEDNNISSNFIINENNNNNNLVKENNNENNLINSDSNSHTIIIDHEDCNGKQSLLAILQRAGKTDLSPATCRELPLWSEVVDLYGNEPIIFGLETCQQYRDIVALNGSEPDPRVAGMFNTGTNALAESLQLNFEYRDVKNYSAPKGKHLAIRQKTPWLRRAQRKQALEFPIVLVRDPFRWMASMCKSSYKAVWQNGRNGHCPNLVPSSDEKRLPRYQNLTTFPVTVQHLPPEIPEKYASLADMWSEWNQAYVELKFPHLMIRFEDTLFHAEKVMAVILECIGRPMKTEFKYHLERSKNLRSSADFVTALAKYGTAKGRDNGLAKEDRVYAQTALNPDLMRRFHYKQVSLDEEHASPVS